MTRGAMTQRGRVRLLTAGSFLLPLLLWMLVSYVPGVWQPMVRIVESRYYCIEVR